MRVLLCIILLSAAALAEPRPKIASRILEVSGAYHLFSGNGADNVAGATYTKRFSPGIATSVRFGTTFGPLYAGIGYEYWFASREVSQNGSTESDKLSFHGGGIEFGGFYRWNPRLFALLTAAVYMPLEASVTATIDGAASVTRATKMPYYQARFGVGIQLFARLSLLLEGGYRYNNLKGVSLGGASLDLSGAWTGMGLGFHF